MQRGLWIVRHVEAGTEVWGIVETDGRDRPEPGDDVRALTLDGYTSFDALEDEVKRLRKLVKLRVYLDAE